MAYWVNTGGVGLLKELVLRLDDGSDLINEFNQIDEKKYDAELKKNYSVVKMAIVFYGKDIKIETR